MIASCSYHSLCIEPIIASYSYRSNVICVLCPGKGVCADPRSGDATFGVGGPGPPTMDNGRQLSLDRGEEKT